MTENAGEIGIVVLMLSFSKSTFTIYIAQTCISGGNILTVCLWINWFSRPWCLKKRHWKSLRAMDLLLFAMLPLKTISLVQ